MLHLSDEIVKQQLIGQLNEYIMTHQEVCDYLGMDSSYLSKLIKQKKLEPFHILKNGKMNVNLFFKSDVEKYKMYIDLMRENRKK